MREISGNGTVRKNGRKWQGVLRVTDRDTGECRQVTVPLNIECDAEGQRNKRMALKRLKEERERIAAQIEADNEREAAEARRKVKIPEGIRKMIDLRYNAKAITWNTWDGYGYSLKHIERGFADKSAEEVGQADIREWLADSLAGGVGATTMKRAKRLLSSYYEELIADPESPITFNPCRAVVSPQPREEPPNPLEADLVPKLNSLLSDMDDCPLRRAATLGLNIGVRVGEACAVTWRRVRFETQQVEIFASYGRNRGRYVLKDTKGHQRRTAPMTLILYHELKRWWEADLAHALELGCDREWLLDRQVIQPDVMAERPLNPNSISRLFTALVKAGNLRGVSGKPIVFHGLRHTYATQWIAHGGDVKALSCILGHKDAAMTLNVYAAADPMAERRGVALVNDFMLSGWSCAIGEGEQALFERADATRTMDISPEDWEAASRIAAARGCDTERIAATALKMGLLSLGAGI